MFYQLLLLLFILATGFQLWFWGFVVPKLAAHKDPEPSKNKGPGVSIVICAHNEAENLKKTLPRILTQNYHSLEVIVVNDGSTDQTAKVLLELQKTASILCTVTIDIEDKKTAGKKFALSKGIEKATNELLLLTDADCYPLSEDWVNHMQEMIQGNTTIGLGYSPYEKQHGLLNSFIRYETVYTALQYLSLAKHGMPYMGVGRNLIYTKSIYQETGGFDAHAHITSGDDDLFVNAAAGAENTQINLHPRGLTISKPKATWREYFRQKHRHTTTGNNYRGKHKRVLGLLALSHTIHLIGGIMLLSQPSMIFVLFLYVGRMIIIMAVCRTLFPRLQAKDLWKWIPLLDLSYLLFYLSFWPALTIGNTERWK